MTVAIIAPMVALPVETTPLFSEDQMRQTAYWIREFSLNLHREVPQKLHGHEHDGQGVEFHPEFIAFIERPCKQGKRCHDLACTHDMRAPDPPERVRTTRAFRILRREAPREFDALWMMCVHGMPIRDVAGAFNERAARLGKHEHYNELAVLTLVISGIHKLQQSY